MSNAFVIEVDDETLGLAVRDGRRFRFISTQPLLRRIDHKLYPSLRALRHAATEVYRSVTARRRRHQPIRAW